MALCLGSVYAATRPAGGAVTTAAAR